MTQLVICRRSRVAGLARFLGLCHKRHLLGFDTCLMSKANCPKDLKIAIADSGHANPLAPTRVHSLPSPRNKVEELRIKTAKGVSGHRAYAAEGSAEEPTDPCGVLVHIPSPGLPEQPAKQTKACTWLHVLSGRAHPFTHSLPETGSFSRGSFSGSATGQAGQHRLAATAHSVGTPA